MARATSTLVKRYIKFLAVCRDPQQLKLLISKSPDSVVKAICDAALNAIRGEVKITPSQKKLFKKHRALLEQLAIRKGSLKTKRNSIIKGGAAPLIPVILSVVLASLGSLLFNK